MNWVIRSTVVALTGAAVLGLAPVAAQDFPGKNLTVTIRVDSAQLSNDSTTIFYKLFNSGTSAEKLLSFMVKAPVQPSWLSVPSPSIDWVTASVYRRVLGARWTALESIVAGDSTPQLSYKAAGFLGIAKAWIQGDSVPLLTSDADTSFQHLDPVFDMSKIVYTLGTVTKPSGATTLSTMISRLQALNDTAYALGWISNVDSTYWWLNRYLNSKFVGTFRTKLTSAFTGTSSVNSQAYWLLKPTADYVMSIADTSGISLHFVCGKKFEIRNHNYATMVLDFSVASFPTQSGTVSATGKTDSAPYSDAGGPYARTYLTTTNVGALSISYLGDLLRTVANPGTPAC